MATDVVTPITTFRVLPFPHQWQYIYGAVTAQGGWNATTASLATSCSLLGGYKATGGISRQPPFSKASAGTATPHCLAIGVSQDTLTAQTISGNVTLTIMAQEASAAADFLLKVYLWVAQAGTLGTVRGVLLDYTGGPEFPTTAAGITTGAQALTPVAVQAGDFLVCEIGFVINGVAANVGTIWLSGGCLGDGTFVGDMTNGAVDNTLGTTLVFDSAVNVNQPIPVSGDVLAGNTMLVLYDGTTGVLKRQVCPPGYATMGGGAMLSDGTFVFAGDTGLSYLASWLLHFNADMSFAGFYESDPGINPHQISADADDVLYVGYVGDDGTGCGEGGDVGTPSAASYAVRKVVAGVVTDSYTITPDLGGSQAVDLASDQRTLFYTSLGRKIKRYDVVADVQLSDFVQLPAAANGEVARGMRILPDSGVLLADAYDIKRLDAAGTVTQTYTYPATAPPITFITGTTYAAIYARFIDPLDFNNFGDWGVVAIDPDQEHFWAANRSNYGSFMYGALAKFNLETGACPIMIMQGYVTPTGGGFCSGGLLVYNEFRAAIDVVPTPAGSGPLGILGCTSVPVIRVRRAPHLADENQRLFYHRFTLDMEAGVGIESGQGSAPTMELRWSNDGGKTWSNWRTMNLGAQGKYQTRAFATQLGSARQRTFEVRCSDPVKTVLLDAYLDFEEGTS